jgi:hypothetical protein
VNLAKDSRPKLHYAGFSLQAKIFGRASGEWQVANSEWRTASGEWQTALTTRSRNGSEWRLAISDWWMTFLEGRKWEGEIPAEPNLIGKS